MMSAALSFRVAAQKGLRTASGRCPVLCNADKEAVIADLQRQREGQEKEQKERKEGKDPAKKRRGQDRDKDLVAKIVSLPRFSGRDEKTARKKFGDVVAHFALDAEGTSLVHRGTNKPVLTEEELQPLISRLHEDTHRAGAGKFNPTNLKDNLKKTYYLTNMIGTVERLVREMEASCPRCIADKKPPQTVQRQQAIVTFDVMEHLQLDLTILKALAGKPIVLSLIDLNSKYAWVRRLPDKSAESVYDVLIEIFDQEGYPDKLHTDNGKEFRNKIIEPLMKKLRVLYVHGKPYKPTTQGAVERFNRTIKNAIYIILRRSKVSVEEALQQAIFFYNNRWHKTVKDKPINLYKGRVVRFRTEAELSPQTLAELEKEAEQIEKEEAAGLLPDDEEDFAVYEGVPFHARRAEGKGAGAGGGDDSELSDEAEEDGEGEDEGKELPEELSQAQIVQNAIATKQRRIERSIRAVDFTVRAGLYNSKSLKEPHWKAPCKVGDFIWFVSLQRRDAGLAYRQSHVGKVVAVNMAALNVLVEWYDHFNVAQQDHVSFDSFKVLSAEQAQMLSLVRAIADDELASDTEGAVPDSEDDDVSEDGSGEGSEEGKAPYQEAPAPAQGGEGKQEHMCTLDFVTPPDLSSLATDLSTRNFNESLAALSIWASFILSRKKRAVLTKLLRQRERQPSFPDKDLVLHCVDAVYDFLDALVLAAFQRQLGEPGVPPRLVQAEARLGQALLRHKFKHVMCCVSTWAASRKYRLGVPNDLFMAFSLAAASQGVHDCRECIFHCRAGHACCYQLWVQLGARGGFVQKEGDKLQLVQPVRSRLQPGTTLGLATLPPPSPDRVAYRVLFGSFTSIGHYAAQLPSPVSRVFLRQLAHVDEEGRTAAELLAALLHRAREFAGKPWWEKALRAFDPRGKYGDGEELVKRLEEYDLRKQAEVPRTALLLACLAFELDIWLVTPQPDSSEHAQQLREYLSDAKAPGNMVATEPHLNGSQLPTLLVAHVNRDSPLEDGKAPNRFAISHAPDIVASLPRSARLLNTKVALIKRGDPGSFPLLVCMECGFSSEAAIFGRLDADDEELEVLGRCTQGACRQRLALKCQYGHNHHQDGECGVVAGRGPDWESPLGYCDVKHCGVPIKIVCPGCKHDYTPPCRDEARYDAVADTLLRPGQACRGRGMPRCEGVMRTLASNVTELPGKVAEYNDKHTTQLVISRPVLPRKEPWGVLQIEDSDFPAPSGFSSPATALKQLAREARALPALPPLFSARSEHAEVKGDEGAGAAAARQFDSIRQLNTLKVAELQDELRLRGAAVSGNKDVLRKRLATLVFPS